ncbi:MAG TPA: glycosyltransferase [Candidatus Acidoferrales bacterium]|jgi:glycosyltransferase involved in cell wall biosynthesis|nr:glycosyltransferase [Candidatus Acidoferrales bacterium]
MRTAVVHDYFTQVGGAEKVAEELFCMLPDSSLYATVMLSNCMPPQLEKVVVNTSWMQRLPNIDKFYRFYFLLYPFAVSSIDLSKYDLVVSSSSSYAKGVKTGRDSIHVCYCHTPMRWAWNYDEYARRDSFGSLQRFVLPPLIRCLKNWDREASRQPDHFVANSRLVAGRILKAYNRTAEVIHPPIDVTRFRISSKREGYYITLARLVSYKRIDLAVRTCTERRKKLIVIGDGPDRQRLEKLAGPSVTFVGRASDREVEKYVAGCNALLFPGEEDFGMAPLEVAAAGKPTIAFGAGGALETIRDGVTGLFFHQQTTDHLANAIDLSEKWEWQPSMLRRHAEEFDIPVFRDRFNSFLKRIGAVSNDAVVISKPTARAATA